ncbi:MAG: hypothetical protein ACE5HX_14175, partial [bacterium]
MTTLPWLIMLRHKYGHWMFGYAGKFNLFYQGEYPQKENPSLRRDAPWFESGTFTKDNKMGGYHDFCPPGDILFTYSVFEIDPYLQLKTFFANLRSLVRFFWDMFGLSSIPILFGLLFSLYVPIGNKPLKLISSSCILWVLMYCLLLVDRRYLLPIAPLIVIIACKGYEEVSDRLGRSCRNLNTDKYRRILLILLLVQLVGSFVWGINRVAHYVRRYHTETSRYVALARDLAETYHIEKLAQTDSCGHTIGYLAYLGDIPYAGAIFLDRHEENWLDVIKKGNISHVVFLSGELDNSETDGLKFVREFSARGKDHLMYEILYDD